MPASDDLLFGKIAVAQKYCSKAQIDECALIQSHESDPPALGELLLYKGYISPEQHAKVLEIQQQTLGKVDPASKKRKEDVLLGKLALKEKLLTQEQLNECLRLQAQEGEPRTLGEVMVSLGYLTPEIIKKLLAKQNKRIMFCPACRLSFTVLSLSQGKDVKCPRCKGPLAEGKPTDSTRVDAEFATQVMKVVRDSARAGYKSDIVRIGAKKIKATCAVCDSSFEGALDETGRIRCPTCRSTFTPR